MIEKDVVKVVGFVYDDCWFLLVMVKIDDVVFMFIENKLNMVYCI